MNVPKLRFKEFSGEWEEKKFEDIFSFSIGKNIKQNEASPDYETPCVRYGELYHMYNEVILKVINKTNLDKSELLFSDGDEILMPSAGEDPLDIGLASALTLKNVAIGRTINILKPLKQNIYSQIFVSYYINSKLRKKISTLAKGSSISNVYNSDLKQLKAKLPTLEEQEKIAIFLNSVDEKIEKLTKKDELLQQYKKSIMQKIFSQEIIFKDDKGKEFPEWEIISLKSIFKERKQMVTKSKNYEHISLTVEGVVAKTERYERDFLVSDDSIKKYKVTKLNDICYNPANLKFGVIARNKYKDGIFSPIYVTFEVINANISFIEYLVTRRDFINSVRKYEEGTVYERQAVKAEDFLRFSIKLPQIEEQNKIANFLSSIDDKIEENQKILKKSKEFKKSLLQQMFV
ncbi:restriction endonuclease subunit S [Aliarcobacter thereius]|nr:restriction endonuclease subunit S [Aliarcobacter thereius]